MRDPLVQCQEVARKTPCSEELQRFRGPLHRRNSVQHWNRTCRKSSGSSCKSIRLAARSTHRSGCETAQTFSSWDSWDDTGIREPPNYSPEPTSGFFLTPMLARIWRRGGIILLLFPQLSCFLSLHPQNPHFLSFTNESQQSLPSQQCPPVSPMDIESAEKK